MKRKDKEKNPCIKCGNLTTRRINFHPNRRNKYDVFVCLKCMKYTAGGE